MHILYIHPLSHTQDEMGLGKTVQVLALVCYYKQVRTVATPSLVLVPASVLPNWQAEAALWAPALRVLTYCGPAAERQKTLCTRVGGCVYTCEYSCFLWVCSTLLPQHMHPCSPCTQLKHRDFDLVLTTYEMAMGNTDRPLLASIQYNILVVVCLACMIPLHSVPLHTHHPIHTTLRMKAIVSSVLTASWQYSCGTIKYNTDSCSQVCRLCIYSTCFSCVSQPHITPHRHPSAKQPS